MKEECFSPVITERLDGNKLYVSVETGTTASDYEYAFYLLAGSAGKSEKEMIWYRSVPTACFFLQHAGDYRTICFIRKRGETDSRPYQSGKIFRVETDAVQVNVPVSIFGSCVTRDVLEHHAQAEYRLTLMSYISRQSLVSAMSPPVSCDEEDVLLDSPFQRRMVLSDLRKDAFEMLKQDKSRYMIIDFIDERFDLLRVDKSYVTASNECIASGFFWHHIQKQKSASVWSFISKQPQALLWDWLREKKIRGSRVKKQKEMQGQYFVDGKPVRRYVEQFAKMLKARYPEDHIIIHKALMQNEYVDREGIIRQFPTNYLKYNHEINDVLASLYDLAEELLPQAHVVDLNCGTYADERHKWGLAPMHYQEEYYQRVLEEILRIIHEQESPAEH